MQRHVKHPVRQLLASVGRYRERDKLLLRLTHSKFRVRRVLEARIPRRYE